MATNDNALKIIKDFHVLCGHKGEKNTHQQTCENYNNISRKLVSKYIKQCEHCIVKLRKKEKNGVVVRPILAKDFNEREKV